MRPVLAAILVALIGAAAIGGQEPKPPALSPTQIEACADEGGCAYVSLEWISRRIAEAKEAGRVEAKTQCGERTRILAGL